MKSHPFELLKAFHIASALAEFFDEVFTPSFTALFFASLLCSLLIALRMSLHDSVAFGFLLWNLFLAWMPFLISRYISFKDRYDDKFAWYMLPAWIFFLPNAPYLITDFVHLHPRSATFWLDALVLFSCASVGLALGIASLLKIHDILLKNLGRTIARLVVATLLPVTAFGIFVGRFLRWNSWDIVINPLSFLKDIFSLFSDAQMAAMLEFTGIFTIFLTTVYVISSKLQQHFKKIPAFKNIQFHFSKQR